MLKSTSCLDARAYSNPPDRSLPALDRALPIPGRRSPTVGSSGRRHGKPASPGRASCSASACVSERVSPPSWPSRSLRSGQAVSRQQRAAGVAEGPACAQCRAQPEVRARQLQVGCVGLCRRLQRPAARLAARARDPQQGHERPLRARECQRHDQHADRQGGALSSYRSRASSSATVSRRVSRRASPSSTSTAARRGMAL